MINSVGPETTSSVKKRDLGDVLVDKEIITPEMLSEALRIISGDTQKKRRNLPWVLSNTFKVDRDRLYLEVAKFYAFRILDISKAAPSDERLAFIRREFNALPDSIKDKAIEYSVLPFSVDPNRTDRLLVATPDPTGEGAVSVARAFRYGKFEICYMPFSQWTDLWKRVAIDRASYQQHAEDVVEMQDESEQEAQQYRPLKMKSAEADSSTLLRRFLWMVYGSVPAISMLFPAVKKSRNSISALTGSYRSGLPIPMHAQKLSPR